MSVVVRMEMPRNCCECQLRQEDYDAGDEFCPFTGVECLSIGRQDNCPIICALPDNHGRLIDASTIIGEVDAGYTDEYGNPIPVNRPISVDEYLGLEVPTIIPAERREE